MRKERRHFHKAASAITAVVVFCSIISFAQAPPAPTPDKKAGEFFKNVQVLKDVPSDQLIPAMQFITSSLGVQCEYCHVEKAFDKDDKKPKQTARKMMQMMFAIDANNFEGHQAVTCYSCHRGSPKPLAIPVIAESQPHLLNEAARPEQANPPNLPKADETVQKYIAALGGVSAISKLSSIAEKGTFQAGGREFPVEIFKKSPDHIATITHFPNGDSTTVFDGHSGWSSSPGRPLRPMLPADSDASLMDADLHLSLGLTTLLGGLKVERSVKIGDQDALMISAQRPGQPPVEMYFDTQTSLLIRLVRYAESPVGRNPTQIDYSDYRDVAGVKVPFQWTSATPTGRFSIHLESAQANIAIPNDKFQKPATPAGSPPGSQ
jgi:photosynthetic reaction center cytochrome c subunit